MTFARLYTPSYGMNVIAYRYVRECVTVHLYIKVFLHSVQHGHEVIEKPEK